MKLYLDIETFPHDPEPLPNLRHYAPVPEADEPQNVSWTEKQCPTCWDEVCVCGD